MKVLHAYSHDNPRLAMYVSLISQAMPPDVECVFADNASDLRLAVKDSHPDIIHQHGRFPAAVVETIDSTGLSDRVSPSPRLVVSPHGEETDTQQAYAVIARSPYEMTILKTERKELVQNPLITRTISVQEAAEAIAAVYRRVMDSNPLELMDAATRRWLSLALKVGLLGDKRWVGNEPLPPSDPDFRHLYIYAEQEGVLDIVQRGLDLLGIDAPEKMPTDCYMPHGYIIPKAMPGASITELLYDIERNGITLLRLTELTKALYDDNLDEEALMEQVEAEKLRPLTQSVLQVLSEQTLLTEGFMPCAPLNNSDTHRLRLQLEKRQELKT